jgi:hypothetical protein
VFRHINAHIAMCSDTKAYLRSVERTVHLAVVAV